MSESAKTSRFNILCLDGGGAKGFYSLGFLRELEAFFGSPLAYHFDAVYGTSTGAIIATLLGLGNTADEALRLYQIHVPKILGAKSAKKKSAELLRVADELFGGSKWEDFKTNVGIVATNWTQEKPLVFKNNVKAAYSMKATFLPGFGCAISEAVRASCSATPFFKPCSLNLQNDGDVEARDGGFCANNPSLFALSDALNAFGVPASNVRLLSLGVGHYPEPKKKLHEKLIGRLPSVRILQRTLNVSANTTEIQLKLLMPQVQHVRVSDRFSTPELAMDFLESNLGKLNLLIQKGRTSFSEKEEEIKSLFK